MAQRTDTLHPLDPCAATMAQTFVEPPPLLKTRSSVKRSYTSLIAMSPSESLLPPTIPPQVSATAPAVPSNQTSLTGNLEAVLASQMTPSPVLDEVINDNKAVADLCTVLNADEGVLISNPDAPSIARSTMYTERRITARDIIGAIDQLWAVDQLPMVELISSESHD